MKIDTYLNWFLYGELSVAFVLFVPGLNNIQRKLLGTFSPLLAQLKFPFLIIWGFMVFVFLTTFKDVIQADKHQLKDSLVDEVNYVQNQKDSLLSLMNLLLLPIIYFHSQSILKIYKLQQSNEALKKQASNVSEFLKQKLSEDKNNKTKSSTNNDSNNNNNIESNLVNAWKQKSEMYETKWKIAKQNMEEYKQKFEDATKVLNTYKNIKKDS